MVRGGEMMMMMMEEGDCINMFGRLEVVDVYDVNYVVYTEWFKAKVSLLVCPISWVFEPFFPH